MCNVSPPVIRRWLSLGLLPRPPWTIEELQQIRNETDPRAADAAQRRHTAF
jgi:hypothetical protein